MRLVGINIPDNKRVEIALTYVYGIGRVSAVKMIKAVNIEFGKLAKDLTPEEINKLKEYIEKKVKFEGELRQIIRGNVKRLKKIQCYRGRRHERKLPARGQRTKTNSRTVRGNIRRTVGSGKRKTELK